MIKPFIKWAGGKTQLLEEIRNQYPQKLGKTITKYAEPFVVGGAVLCDILNNYNLKEIYINDINAELINTYQTIKENVNFLIEELTEYKTEYLKLLEEERENYYYSKRDRFNELKTKHVENIESAALFIFLNKTCFNGLYRVNKKGLFNVPFNHAKNPAILDEENLKEFSIKLQNVTIHCGDYKESELFIDKKTFAYFDPPYRPLTQTAAFTSYSQDGFSDKNQVELGQFVNKITKKGAKVVLSNSDPKNTDSEDNFFDNLYSKFSILRINAARMINSNSTKRGAVKELLISNY